MSTMIPQVPFQAFAAAERTIAPGGFARALTALFDRFYDWQQRSAERALLASLDEAQLRDMGISRTDLVHEVSKPFWRA